MGSDSVGSVRSGDQIVIGKFNALLLPNGSVKMWLSTLSGTDLQSLLAKNLDTAEEDFVRTYGLSKDNATAFRAQLERNGSAAFSVPIRNV